VARDPDRAERHVALIVAVAREALAEFGRLARPPSAADDGAPPSLSRLDDLADRARATGLSVTLQVDGPPIPLPAGIDLAAFRIVQEALANTAKHARAHAAWVTVRYHRRAVELEVRDDGCAATTTRGSRGDSGHGLVGMRERAALYGGTLDAGPHPTGGYRVYARLPIDETA
jgi:signal transduction histidine kinase